MSTAPRGSTGSQSQVPNAFQKGALFPRLLAVFVVAMYSMNSQNFKACLTPHERGVRIKSADKSMDGHYKRSELTSPPESMVYYSENHRVIKYDTIKKQWGLFQDSSLLASSEMANRKMSPCEATWPSNLEVEKWEVPIISNLMLVFLCHVGCVILFPYFIWNRDGRSIVLAVKKQFGWGKLAVYSSMVTCAQMGVNYFWSLSSTRLPVQTLSCIFQTAVFLIYLLSIPILGEKFTWTKTTSVFLTFLGVSIASYCMPVNPEDDVVFASAAGIIFALCAELLKSFYQVWFKWTFGAPDREFVALLLVLVGVAHFILILPLIFLADYTGFEEMVFNIGEMPRAHMIMIFAAIGIASGVNFGSLYIVALTSPTFWAVTLTLSIPMSVGLDLIFQGIAPTTGSMIGIFFVCISLFMFYGEIDLNEKEKIDYGPVDYESTSLRTGTEPSIKASSDMELGTPKRSSSQSNYGMGQVHNQYAAHTSTLGKNETPVGIY